jgi:hypothetical protein
MHKDKLEDIVIKQIIELTEFIRVIDEMLNKDDEQIKLMKKLLETKIKQVIWFPDNTWIWYNWN